MKFLLPFSDVLYAAGHFYVDFFCALTMVSLVNDPWLFVLYNFLAFAVQMPIGLIADFVGRNRSFALVGVMLVLMGMLPLPVMLRVILIGLGNASYHVGGGREALLWEEGFTGLGIFVAPGAMGIYLGTVFAGDAGYTFMAACILALIGIGMIFFCDGTPRFRPRENCRITSAALMFGVVVLRSLVGLAMETPWKVGVFLLLSAVAATAGKALGGILADRIGWKWTGITSLLITALLFLIPDLGFAGVLGVLLFNMTMPITLRQAAASCRGYEGFAFGLLTFGLFLGYVPTAFGFALSPVLGCGLALASAVGLALDRSDAYG